MSIVARISTPLKAVAAETTAEKRTMTQLVLLPPCTKVICASGIFAHVVEVVETGFTLETTAFKFVGLQLVTTGAAGAEVGPIIARTKTPPLSKTPKDLVVIARCPHAAYVVNSSKAKS